MASLLEVGTGFHGELTGRENIHLNGTILGMSRKEVDWKFKEIIAFCELEKFIDTPVKYYSSGMYVRLAFAVAAHLEPEILFVDEVLSVGDASFQKKCIGKMQNVAKEGRTVLFVSHQMSAVKSLCSRVIRIDQGLVVQDGQPATVIANYLESASTQIVPERVWDQEGTRPGNSQFHLTAVRVLGAEGIIKKVFDSSRPITMEMEFILRQIDPALFVGFVLINQNGIVLLQSCHNHTEESDWPSLRIGANRLQCEIPPNILNNGIYYVRPRIGLNFANYIIFNEVEISFEVRIDHCKSPFWNASADVAFPGVIAPFFHWTALSPYLENIHEAS